MVGARWPAASLSREWGKPIDGAVCAIMWPTRALADNARWFDELYVWTEGFQASTMQRARIQYNALTKAFRMLEAERVERIAVTLSFGTVERLLDQLTDTFDTHPFVTHRIVVLLRGQLDRLRSPYRVQGFVEWLRAHGIPVGYRLTSPRISMEMRAIDLVRPEFLKIMAPTSKRVEYWQDVLVETRTSSLDPQWVIVAGLEDDLQKRLATEVGFGFGQGTAVKPPYSPPSTQIATLPETFSELDAPSTVSGQELDTQPDTQTGAVANRVPIDAHNLDLGMFEPR